jgi:hypothetical protein
VTWHRHSCLCFFRLLPKVPLAITAESGIVKCQRPLLKTTGISEIKGFTGYVRSFSPNVIEGVMLMGIHVPIRLENTTIMPGDPARPNISTRSMHGVT